MKVQKVLLIAMLSVSLGACVTQREARELSYPAVDSVAHAFVGEPMLEQGYGFLVDKIEITDASELVGTNINGIYTVTASTPDGDTLSGEQYLHLNKHTNMACFYGAFKPTTDCTKVSYKQSSTVDFANSYRMQRTLIYSGRIGNRVKLGYREFINGFARDAFSNEAEYDINESKQIGYKKALIEVIDASNTQITYKVLRNF